MYKQPTLPGGGLTQISLRRLVFTSLVLVPILLIPTLAVAQEAIVTGTITDATGGVLPGVTVTAVHEATGNTFVAVTDAAGGFRLPVRTGVRHGQEVTNNMVQSFGQPKFSRDSIAEFEFVSNRFDASQGRSMGVQVNAITKSGTNIPNGTFSGYFRDDTFIAKDFVQNRVLPYQDQQLSVTYGPSFNFDEKSNNTKKKVSGVRCQADTDHA